MDLTVCEASAWHFLLYLHGKWSVALSVLETIYRGKSV